MSRVTAPCADAATVRRTAPPGWSGVAGAPVLMTSTETSEVVSLWAKPGPLVVVAAFPVFS